MDNIFTKTKEQSAATAQALEEAAQIGEIVNVQSQEVFGQNQVTQDIALQEYRAAVAQEDKIRNIPDIILSVAKFINPDYDKKLLQSKKEQAIFNSKASSEQTTSKLQALDMQRKSGLENADIETKKLVNVLTLGQAERAKKEADQNDLVASIEKLPTSELSRLAGDKNNPNQGLHEQELVSRRSAALQMQNIANAVQLGQLEVAEKGRENLLSSFSDTKFNDLLVGMQNGDNPAGFTTLQVAQEQQRRDAIAAGQAAKITNEKLANAQIEIARTEFNNVAAMLANQGQDMQKMTAALAVLEDIPTNMPADQKVALVEGVKKLQTEAVIQYGQRLGLNAEQSALLVTEAQQGTSYPSPILSEALIQSNASSIIASGKFSSAFTGGNKESIVGISDPVEYITAKSSDVAVLQNVTTLVDLEVTSRTLAHFADQNELLQSVGGGRALANIRNFDSEPISTTMQHIRQVARDKGFSEDQAKALALEAAAYVKENAQIVATQLRESTSIPDRAVLAKMFGAGDVYANSATGISKDIYGAVDTTWRGPSILETTGQALSNAPFSP